jgi:hypothetical protein
MSVHKEKLINYKKGFFFYPFWREQRGYLKGVFLIYFLSSLSSFFIIDCLLFRADRG